MTHSFASYIVDQKKGIGKKSKNKSNEPNDSIQQLAEAQIKACEADVQKNSDYCQYIKCKNKAMELVMKKKGIEYKKVKLEYEHLKIKMQRESGLIDDAVMFNKIAQATKDIDNM